MAETSLSIEAQEALTTARLGGLKKRLNEESWSDHMEDLLKSWGEKAAGLRFMHNNAAGFWKGLGNKLTLWGIGITTIASTAALTTAGIEDVYIKDTIIYSIGGVGVFATLIQSAKKFYNAEEKAADHAAIAKQFGSFYRYMTLQMGMARTDRIPADELSAWALKEFERLQQEAPPLGGGPISAFKKAFGSSAQAVPDVCEDEFIINIFGREEDVVASVSSNKPVTMAGVDLESNSVSVEVRG
jgi:hypothetical protein